MCQKVKCKICETEIGQKAFGAHLKRKHQVEFIDYVNKHYDNSPKDFPRWGRCGVCNVLCVRNRNTDYPSCSVEHSAILRKEYSKGRKAWNKGLTKENNKSLKKMANTRKKQGNFKEGFVHSEKTKQKLSKSMKGKLLGEKNGMFGKTHTPEAIRKIFKHRKMNKLEKIVANILDQNNIEYHFQYFINDGDVCKSYDFKLKNKNIIIEVNGDFWHGNPNAKHHWKDVDKVKQNDELKTKIAEERGFTVIHLWESEIKTNPNIILEKV